jgi:hypothetical protein
MKKPDSTLSCFFGDCAKMPANPSSARDRDGPTIVSETDQLQHIWQQHQLTTLKAIEPAFCQFCDQ